MIALDGLTPEEKHRRHQYIRMEQKRRERRKAQKNSLIHYLRRIWPWFVVEEVHLLMAGYIEALVFGAIERYMQFLAPRAGKSMIGSIIAPSFYLGNYPGDKVMQASHQKELSVEFGREARDIIVDTDFRDIFLGVTLKSDAKAAGRWHTNQRGAYFAAGVTGGIAGKGWNFGSADDLLNEQTAYSDVANRKVLNWWGPGFYTRRQPDRSRLMLTTTRWRKGDIAGFLLQNAKTNPRADQYTVLRVPALIDEATAEILNEHSGDPLLTPAVDGKPIRYKAGDSFSPRRMSKDFLLRQRANMSSRSWDALYDQNPTDDEGAIIKRAWWRAYKSGDGKPPKCLYMVQVYDTAFEEKEMGLTPSGKKTGDPDFSARTTWGVFEHTDFNGIVRPCAILLERWKDRVGFPELREEAWRAYRQWKPDKVIIEKKASGHCYSEDTQILTQRGWLRFDELDISRDLFATRNPMSKQFEWQSAVAQTQEQYSGPMVRFGSRTVDALVTPNHRMLVNSLPRALGGNHTRKGELLVEAGKLVGLVGGKTLIPATSRWTGVELGRQRFPISEEGRRMRFVGGSNLKWLNAEQEARRKANCALATEKTVEMSGDDYCAFMGAFLSEGWTRVSKRNKGAAVFVSQRKQGTEAFLQFEALLSRILGRPVRHDGEDFVIARRGLAEHVRQFGSRAWDKFVPESIRNATPRQLAIFWRYYMLGDGSVASGMQTISTSSYRIADHLVEIAQKMGYSASCSKRPGLTRDRIICSNKRVTLAANCKPQYIIRLRVSRTQAFRAEYQPYSGMIHCVQVPNGVVYVRRNGKPMWCGNSLLQEMRRRKVPVLGVTIAKGASKTARAHAAAVVPEQGCVFYMAAQGGLVDEKGLPLPMPWAKEVIDEMTEFPFGDFDDIADTCVHAWLWLRRTMWVELPGETQQERLAEEIEEESARGVQGERNLFG